MDYRSKKMKWQSNKIWKVILVILAVFLGICAFAFFAMTLDWLKSDIYGMGTVMFAFVIGVAFLAPVIKIIEVFYLVHEAKVMNSCLELVHDGMFSWNRLDDIRGKKEAIKILIKLVHKNYLTGIRIDREKRMVILMENKEKEKKISYMIRKCPGCGAECKMQEDSHYICEFCGQEF